MPRGAGFDSLTAREREVLDALAATGGTNAEIAHILGCRPATVSVHLRAIAHKLDVHNRTQMVLVARERGTQ